MACPSALQAEVTQASLVQATLDNLQRRLLLGQEQHPFCRR